MAYLAIDGTGRNGAAESKHKEFIVQAVQRVFLVICVGVVLSPVATQADLIVSYSGNTVTPGGPGIVSVYVSSNAAPGTPDVLDSFSARFRITPTGGAVANGLQFTDPQGDSQLTNSGYVFFGNSLAHANAAAVGIVSTVINPNDDYIGGDGTVNGLGVSLSTATASRLLFRLNVSAAFANHGDSFDIALVNDATTDFWNPGFDSLPINASSFNAFTVTAAAAVPEPGTTTALMVVGFVMSVVYQRRKQRRTSDSAVSQGLDDTGAAVCAPVAVKMFLPNSPLRTAYPR